MGKKNVTFVITEELDHEIELRAFLNKKQKSEILSEALNLYFSQNKRPQLSNEIEAHLESSSKSASAARSK